MPRLQQTTRLRAVRVTVAAVGVLLLGAGGAAVPRYNAYVASSERVAAAWAQVRNVEQRRIDLIPQLIRVVDAHAAHESALIARLTAARHEYVRAPESDPAVNQLETLDAALFDVIALQRRHPTLGAAAHFRDLAAELRGAENRVAIERARYNQAVAHHRTLIRQFPLSIFAQNVMHLPPLFSDVPLLTST